ncbi:MAG: hypothetical protein P1P82_03890 [Bacteroidales bacterium]|nr:hypothetical protein [Bacteroidales bacterium]
MDIFLHHNKCLKSFFSRYTVFLLMVIVPANMRADDLNDLTTPVILNYSRSDYNGATQNWAITQGLNNIMWFGNNGRAIWFDGDEWGQVHIPNNSIVRSLQTTTTGRIFAGSFAEFGEITMNESGAFVYDSWIGNVPEKFRDFNDIWRIHELNNVVYFQSFERILKFRQGEFIGTIEPEGKFRFSFVSNGRLFIEEAGVGLKVLLNNELTLIEKGDFFAEKEVWFVGYSGPRLMVATQKEGVYIFENGKWNSWDTPVNQLLLKNSLFSAIQLKEGGCLFGTTQNGLIISDENGNIKKLINSKKGLQNNTVLSLYVDSENNYWLGLDHGIDYLKINFPISRLFREEGLGTGYASIHHKGTYFFGTNQGIYSWSEDEGEFVLLENTGGQVWSFEILEDRLLCCHNNGIYEVFKDRAEHLFDLNGAWKIMPVPDQEGVYIAGGYSGLYRITLGNSPELTALTGFGESCRVFEFDEQGDLWMSHGYKGVYKLRLTSDYTAVDQIMSFGSNQGLPSNFGNGVFTYNNEIIITTQNGFYTYNDIIGLMQPYEKWNEMLPLEHPVSTVKIDRWNRVMFFHAEKLIWTIIENDSLVYIDSTSFLPLENQFFYAFENIYFPSQNVAIIGTIDGFSVYNRDLQYREEAGIPLFIKRIYYYEGSSGSLKRNEINPTETDITLPLSQNILYLELSVPVFQNKEYLQTSYMINGGAYQNVDNNTIVLQNLKSGHYQIRIRTRDLTNSNQSETAELHITILPPWYKRWYAIIMYLIFLGILSTIGIILYRRNLKIIRRKEKISQTRKMNQKQLELRRQSDDTEKELIMMRNEKLRSEIRLKAEEIANSTMELVLKNKMLLEVKDTLSKIQKEKDIEIRNSSIKSMLRNIDRDLNNEENWRVFEKNFDEVHENFLNRLKERHPVLTSKDLRLCAYLRMNLSSKEIAPLLRISPRSVEISRYRLRKKMELSHTTNLSDYILLF